MLSKRNLTIFVPLDTFQINQALHDCLTSTALTQCTVNHAVSCLAFVKECCDVVNSSMQRPEMRSTEEELTIFSKDRYMYL